MNAVTLTPAMRLLSRLLDLRTGQILSDSRLWRLDTALRPLVRAEGCKSLEELASMIGDDIHGPLAQAAVDALLNNETSFFRDAHVFRTIGHDILPHLMERIGTSRRDRKIRVWSAGCSTGQEAYSLAILFRNGMARWPEWKLEIVASDVSTSALARARKGLYTQSDAQRGLPIGDLLNWMAPVGDDWQMSEALRRMIDFRVDNLFDEGDVTGEFDLVLCRNVLLYFSPERKRRMFDRLASQCAVGGFLLLGAGETIIGQTRAFAASARFRGTYERVEQLDLAAGQ